MRGINLYFIVISSGLFLLQLEEVLSHGMLVEPVNRGSMWRKGYSTPINYDDNGNFCGGFRKQWYENDGNCGVCGDDYSVIQPRPNENTGTYGTGIVVATYDKGSWVNLTVLITANHLGYFEFSICPLADGQDEIETEDCFNEYPLILDDESYRFALTTSKVGTYTVTVKLPDSLTCARCVLRWHWTTGNSWGICASTGLNPPIGALGCGPQETFRTCSDIAIV